MGRVTPRPVGPHLVVKPLPGDEMSEGGVLLPEPVRLKASRGMVVEIGPGWRDFHAKDEPEWLPIIGFERGDIIIWDLHEGVGIEVNGEELVVLHAHDVLVVLEEAPDRHGVRVP